MSRCFLPLLLAGIVTLLLPACGEKNTFVPPPPLEVEVVHPQVGPVTVYLEMPGRTVSFARAEVRARVKGFLKEVKFKPGKAVKAGDPLFTIEPEQFLAAVDTAKGQEAKARADLEIATTNYENGSRPPPPVPFPRSMSPPPKPR
jgi:multidrug efflux system membrane fusion protein